MTAETRPGCRTSKDSQNRGQALAASAGDLRQQCLRVLRCTASAMAGSPGGLRFKVGSRVWLEGLPTKQSGRSKNASPTCLAAT